MARATAKFVIALLLVAAFSVELLAGGLYFRLNSIAFYKQVLVDNGFAEEQYDKAIHAWLVDTKTMLAGESDTSEEVADVVVESMEAALTSQSTKATVLNLVQTNLDYLIKYVDGGGELLVYVPRSQVADLLANIQQEVNNGLKAQLLSLPECRALNSAKDLLMDISSNLVCTTDNKQVVSQNYELLIEEELNQLPIGDNVLPQSDTWNVQQILSDLAPEQQEALQRLLSPLDQARTWVNYFKLAMLGNLLLIVLLAWGYWRLSLHSRSQKVAGLGLILTLGALIIVGLSFAVTQFIIRVGWPELLVTPIHNLANTLVLTSVVAAGLGLLTFILCKTALRSR